VIRTLAVVSLLLAGVVACLHTAEHRAEAALEADRERVSALIAADAKRLARVLHPSLTYTHSNGGVDTRDSLIEKVVSGRVDYRAIELEQPEVRVRRDTAVVTGPVRMEVVAGERRFRLKSVYTAVYWWEDRRWQLVAYQSSAVTSP
jgi:hypothetical protein